MILFYKLNIFSRIKKLEIEIVVLCDLLSKCRDELKKTKKEIELLNSTQYRKKVVEEIKKKLEFHGDEKISNMQSRVQQLSNFLGDKLHEFETKYSLLNEKR